MRSLYSQSEVHLLCDNSLIKFMVNNQPFNDDVEDDEMWNVGEIVLLICCLLLDTQESVCVAARCSESVGWLALAKCVSGPLRGLHADLCAQSEGSYLRLSEWDGPRRLDITRPSRILIMGEGVEWKWRAAEAAKTRPLESNYNYCYETHIDTFPHTQQQAYTTPSPWRAHAHTESQHDSTLSFSLVIAIVLAPAPPWPKRCTSIFSVP